MSIIDNSRENKPMQSKTMKTSDMILLYGLLCQFNDYTHAEMLEHCNGTYEHDLFKGACLESNKMSTYISQILDDRGAKY